MGEKSDKARVVSEAIDAWNAGEREGLAELLAPDAEIRTLRSELESRAYRGPDGFRRAIIDFDEDWEYVRFAPTWIRASGDFVVTLVNVQSRGRASGVELDIPIGWLWEFRDDLIVRIQSFSEPDEALRAAGLEPEQQG